MGRLFSLDSPLFSFLSKVADLIILNILVMICCIPIVTVGASLTALHYVVLKMVRNEDSYIVRSYFKSFKQNFRQATVIWLIMLLIFAVLLGDAFILRFSTIQFSNWIRVGLITVTVIVLLATMHLFPVLSRFDNTIKNTFKNSFFMGILTLPKTVLMLVCWAAPLVIAAFVIQATPVVFMLGISAPAYLCAMLYNKTFKRFEPDEEIAGDDEWTLAPLEGEEEDEEDEQEQTTVPEPSAAPDGDENAMNNEDSQEAAQEE